MAKSPRCQFATAGARGLVTKVCGGESLGSGSMEFRSNNIPRRMSEPLAQLGASACEMAMAMAKVELK